MAVDTEEGDTEETAEAGLDLLPRVEALKARLKELKAPIYGTKLTLWERLQNVEAPGPVAAAAVDMAMEEAPREPKRTREQPQEKSSATGQTKRPRRCQESWPTTANQQAQPETVEETASHDQVTTGGAEIRPQASGGGGNPSHEVAAAVHTLARQVCNTLCQPHWPQEAKDKCFGFSKKCAEVHYGLTQLADMDEKFKLCYTKLWSCEGWPSQEKRAARPQAPNLGSHTVPTQNISSSSATASTPAPPIQATRARTLLEEAWSNSRNIDELGEEQKYDSATIRLAIQLANSEVVLDEVLLQTGWGGVGV